MIVDDPRPRIEQTRGELRAEVARLKAALDVADARAIGERERAVQHLRARALEERDIARQVGGPVGDRIDVAAAALQRVADEIERGEHHP